jgi:hypothetical protein
MLTSKEKIKPVFLYWRDFKPVGLTLITVFRDAVCGFMPPLEDVDNSLEAYKTMKKTTSNSLTSIMKSTILVGFATTNNFSKTIL